MTAIEALRNRQRQLDPDGIEVGVSRQALDETLSRLAEVEAVLKEIRDSPYCDYESQTATSYGTGVVDGYRSCAEIARKALERGE